MVDALAALGSLPADRKRRCAFEVVGAIATVSFDAASNQYDSPSRPSRLRREPPRLARQHRIGDGACSVKRAVAVQHRCADAPFDDPRRLQRLVALKADARTDAEIAARSSIGVKPLLASGSDMRTPKVACTLPSPYSARDAERPTDRIVGEPVWVLGRAGGEIRRRRRRPTEIKRARRAIRDPVAAGRECSSVQPSFQNSDNPATAEPEGDRQRQAAAQIRRGRWPRKYAFWRPREGPGVSEQIRMIGL